MLVTSREPNLEEQPWLWKQMHKMLSKSRIEQRLSL